MTSQFGYMQLSRFLDLVRKRSFSQEADARLEYLLYQLSLAMLKHERSSGEAAACSSALMELEQLNRILMDSEGRLEEQEDIDRKLISGLKQIVTKIGGETQCSMLIKQLTKRPSA